MTPALAERPGGGKPGDRLVTAVPARVRRHRPASRPRRASGDDRVDVATVQRVHVALDDRSRRARRPARAASPAGCARQSLVDVRYARLRALVTAPGSRSLSSVCATSRVEKPSTSRRSSTARWLDRQVLDRRDERQLHALAPLVPRLGCGESASTASCVVGYGSTPRRLGGRSSEVVVRICGRTVVDRKDPLRSALVIRSSDVLVAIR